MLAEPLLEPATVGVPAAGHQLATVTLGLERVESLDDLSSSLSVDRDAAAILRGDPRAPKTITALVDRTFAVAAPAAA